MSKTYEFGTPLDLNINRIDVIVMLLIMYISSSN